MNERARAMLTELVELLDTLPPERFDYNVWVGRDWKGAPDLSCGTTACAAGWATTLPSFQSTGLRLRGRTVVCGDVGVLDGDGVDAMAEALGISVGDAEFLFSPDVDRYGRQSPGADASAVEVAAHIRRFLAEEAS